ncbi:MAG: hypothetical protein K2Q09_11175 [Phycisphaerales bacterium]|jgi:hypothetical protein|nr:hypothetical protein [Phycisphaerales bacterium]
MAAHRVRHRAELRAGAPDRRPAAETVYECPECERRHLGEQRCADCNLFCRSLGPGGECPCCGEPVAISDLLGELA